MLDHRLLSISLACVHPLQARTKAVDHCLISLARTTPPRAYQVGLSALTCPILAKKRSRTTYFWPRATAQGAGLRRWDISILEPAKAGSEEEEEEEEEETGREVQAGSKGGL